MRVHFFPSSPCRDLLPVNGEKAAGPGIYDMKAGGYIAYYALRHLIRQGKLDQLENTMQSGAQHGMRTMDTAIQEMLDKGLISGRSAYEKSMNKQRFEQVKDVG